MQKERLCSKTLPSLPLISNCSDSSWGIEDEEKQSLLLLALLALALALRLPSSDEEECESEVHA